MTKERAILDSMISQIAKDDINLYNILIRLNQGLSNVTDLITPLQTTVANLSIPTPIPANVLIFTYTLRPTSVHFEWTAPDNVARTYEIRKGTVWESADFIIRTSSLAADINPILVGSHTYLIKSINVEGIYSVDALPLIVIVPAIGIINLTATTIDNNVLLNWSTPTSSFEISYYILTKQRDADPVQEVGHLTNNFTAIFETASGTYTYTVQAVDIAGNTSPIASVVKEVRQPPDFELLTEFTSLLDQTHVNTLTIQREGTPILIANINLTETWEDHFLNAGNLTFQEMIDAGYIYFLQPTLLSGYYEEVVDLGAVISNVIINLSWNQTQVAGSTAIAVEMSDSLDDITYNTPIPGSSVFFSSLQYVKFRLTFTAVDDTAILELSNLHGAVDVKREIDSGEEDVFAADASGTEIFFNKVFKDIDSITCTSDSTAEVTVVKTFVDVPDPISFHIRAFDSTGARVDATVSWKARGIV